MIAMTLSEVAAATGGKLSANANPSDRVTASVEFDSRKIRPGGLYIAFPGERVNGHSFAAQAVADGAVAVLATEEVTTPAIYVQDGLEALARLASEVVRRSSATIVAVTGSNGKTSTKDIIGQLCSHLGPTVATEANFNNELGHPYTVCRTTEDTSYLVLETAARFTGNITELCEIAPPAIGVVLNVGISHLDGFGSIENTARAKGELPRFLPQTGTAILNADDPYVAAMAEQTRAAVTTFGIDHSADIYPTDMAETGGRYSFQLHTPRGVAHVTLPLHGRHQVANALAGAAVAHTIGASPALIAQALNGIQSRSERRMDVYTRYHGLTVIDDSYNANPASMAAAVRSLAELPAKGGRRIAALGLMADLVDHSQTCHRELGQQAADAGIDLLIAIGEGTEPMLQGAADRIETLHLPDQDSAIGYLKRHLTSADTVLVKGSRYRTWDVADFLRTTTLSEEETDS